MDLSNPQVPVVRGRTTFLPSGFSPPIKIVGSIAYVGVGGAGMAVVDVSNPLSPRVLTTVSTPGGIAGVIGATSPFPNPTLGGTFLKGSSWSFGYQAIAGIRLRDKDKTPACTLFLKKDRTTKRKAPPIEGPAARPVLNARSP